MAVTVEEVMTRGVVTCRPDDSLSEAVARMCERGCGILPVVDRRRGELVGVLTDRDVSFAVAREELPPFEMPVSLAMSSPVETVREGESIENVHRTMREHGFRRLPVVDAEGGVVGIVSIDDLALETGEGTTRPGDTYDRELARTLRAVCRRTDPRD